MSETRDQDLLIARRTATESFDAEVHPHAMLKVVQVIVIAMFQSEPSAWQGDEVNALAVPSMRGSGARVSARAEHV